MDLKHKDQVIVSKSHEHHNDHHHHHNHQQGNQSNDGTNGKQEINERPHDNGGDVQSNHAENTAMPEMLVDDNLIDMMITSIFEENDCAKTGKMPLKKFKLWVTKDPSVLNLVSYYGKALFSNLKKAVQL